MEFAQFVTGMVNRKKIVSDNKVSRKTLSKKFKLFFDHPLTAKEIWDILPPKITTSKSPWVLGIDGKWLKRLGVVMVYRDVTNKENLFWAFHKSESSLDLQSDIKELSQLISQTGGNYPTGTISDWKQAIVTAVATHFGLIPHQRCIVHVLRLAKKLLPKNSPIAATIKLREIALDLKNIVDDKQRMDWLERINDWEKKYNHFLKEKTINLPNHKRKWWYTHSNLRRGFRLLTYDTEPLFVYLTNNLIPKSNNSLEGVNSQLDQKLGSHRGMKVQQQAAFVFWYLTFNNQSDNLPRLRKLWAYWKRTGAE